MTDLKYTNLEYLGIMICLFMLALESRYLTVSDRRSSGTQNDTLLVKIEQEIKDLKWVLLNKSNTHLEYFAVVN